MATPPVVAPPTAPPPPPPRARRGRPPLRDPVTLKAKRRHTVPVKDPDGSLHKFMSLPPGAYSALDPSSIARVPPSPDGGRGGGPADDARFQLTVRSAALLGVRLEPTVYVSVSGVPAPGGGPGLAAVRLRADDCQLRGSSLVQQLRIDERFDLAFDATLTWRPGAAARAGEGGAITADIDVSVSAEPVGPFLLMPRSALAAAGDAVLGGLSSALLPRFLGLLAADYERWRTDADYRARRERAAGGGG